MNWEEIRRDYESTDITMKDLADKHGVKPSTLRSRKNREKWSDDKRNATNNVATRNATQRKVVATKRIAAKTQEVLNDTDLEDWEEVYCLEYLKCFNRTKAYQRAKPETTYASAAVMGSRKFKEIKIQKRLGELKQAQKEDLYLDLLDIKREWVKQAFADITDFVDFGTETRQEYNEDTGEMEDVARSYVRLKEADDVDGTMIQEVKLGRDGVSVRLHDKQKAMNELMKYLGEDNSMGSKIVFVDSEDAMKKYMEANPDEYSNIDK